MTARVWSPWVATSVPAAALILMSCAPEPNAAHTRASMLGETAVAALAAVGSDGELWLSSMGLYADIRGKRLAADVLEYAPEHALWSDGAQKRRWLRLPEGARIDSSQMDDWQFPVGTLLYKEFEVRGRRIETRVIARTGAGVRDYWMGAFVWSDDEADARFVAAGQKNARGTAHDVPSSTACGTCHNGEPGRVLGVSAVQRPDMDPELLTHPVPSTVSMPPGTRSALGYLHANCAHCHNPGGSARPDTDMDLRLSISDTEAQAAAARTAVSRGMRRADVPEVDLRVAPGDPERSGIYHRMTERGSPSQMPPIGTERVDEAGVELIREWISSLAAP